VSSKTYVDVLDYTRPTDELMAQATVEWNRAVTGQVPVERLDPDDLEFQIKLFQATHPNRFPTSALDPFRVILRGYSYVIRRALARGRGLMLA
jgi:hypothetical protein